MYVQVSMYHHVHGLRVPAVLYRNEEIIPYGRTVSIVNFNNFQFCWKINECTLTRDKSIGTGLGSRGVFLSSLCIVTSGTSKLFEVDSMRVHKVALPLDCAQSS